MEVYAGLDLHSTNTYVAMIDGENRVLYKRRHRNDLSSILSALDPLRKDIKGVVVESTYNWYWLVDELMDAGYTVKLVNTVAVKVYDGLKYTSDEHDARHLAHLLRLGILPTGYIYPKEERSVRDLLRKRSQLVRCRTAQILSIQNLVSRNTGHGIKADQIRELDEAMIRQLSNDDDDRAMAVKSNLEVLSCLDEQIRILERAVMAKAKLKPSFEKLLTVPGIGNILGLTIMYEAGDVGRFAKVGQFASYARCVQSSRWSNNKKKGEGNRKNGNKHLGWAFVEAANFSVRYSERARRFFQRKKAKTKAVVALKAVAHKLARACYHVLKDQVPFDESKAFA